MEAILRNRQKARGNHNSYHQSRLQEWGLKYTTQLQTSGFNKPSHQNLRKSAQKGDCMAPGIKQPNESNTAWLQSKRSTISQLVR